MDRRSPLVRGLWLLALASQVGLPAAAAAADAALDGAGAHAAAHVESHTTSTCARIHPPDCALCHFLAAPFTARRPAALRIAITEAQEPRPAAGRGGARESRSPRPPPPPLPCGSSERSPDSSRHPGHLPLSPDGTARWTHRADPKKTPPRRLAGTYTGGAWATRTH